MSGDERVVRTAEVIGRPAYDRSGGYLGRVCDLVLACEADGRWRVREVVVTAGPWGRVLGYGQRDQCGPWLLLVLARWLIQRRVKRLPWTGVHIGEPPDRA